MKKFFFSIHERKEANLPSGPVKKRLNDCNYVIQKSARSRPFVVHVDRMRRYLHDQDDSVVDTSDKPSVSDTTGMLGRS